MANLWSDEQKSHIRHGISGKELMAQMSELLYLYRGKANALAESILLAMGRNINKLHCKIQSGRTGQHLFELKVA